jgi:dipeptidyl aminopeptidase/acylaminoacyl peptidase
MKRRNQMKQRGFTWSAWLTCSFAIAVGSLSSQRSISQSLAGSDKSAAQTPPIHGVAGGRAMVPQDLLTIREYEAKAISPDGKMVAVVIRRWASGATKESGDQGLNHRSELWVVEMGGKVRKQITPSGPVTLSQSSPIWSPDGQQLAFLSNESEDNAFLEVWDRSTGHVRRLSTVGVDINAQINQTRIESGDDGDGFAWVGNHDIIVILLPEGIRSHSFDEFSRSAALANSGARTAARGQKMTAIVVSSPPNPAKITALHSTNIVMFDTLAGTSRVLGELPTWQARMAERDVVLSPNGQWAAVVSSVPATELPHSNGPLRLTDLSWNRLGLLSLQRGSNEIHWIKGIQPIFRDIPGYVTLSWRPDSSEFSFWGQSEENRSALCIGGVNAATAEWRPIALFDSDLAPDLASILVTQIRWLPDNQVAIRARNPTAADTVAQRSWWIVAGGRATHLDSDDPRLKVNAPAAEAKLEKLETSETGRLFTKDDAGHERTLFPDLNPQLAEIEEPRWMSFDYLSLDGTKQYAKLLLPHDYVAGTRYPTVVFVYGGRTQSEDGSPADRNESDFLNLLLLAGHGYAVLFPSMPLRGIDPMPHLNDGVDPAVDRAVGLGITDPNRLAVMGHSYGGYSVYGMITQTRRYLAGIGLMGVSDLVSGYAEFDPRYRYSDPNWASIVGPLGESSQLGIGVPPWVEPKRYIRNSPIFSSNKIETPLLIVSGDLDGIPGMQDEQMFTVLNRQGKRVEFVRYLGEQHGLESPPNILDMWQRVFAWLDTYVKNPTAAK